MTFWKKLTTGSVCVEASVRIDPLCLLPFAITVVIIPRSPSMSIVLKQFFRHLSQRKSDFVELIRGFLCNLHFVFLYSLLIRSKNSGQLVTNPSKGKSFLLVFVQQTIRSKKIFYTQKQRKKAILFRKSSITLE